MLVYLLALRLLDLLEACILLLLPPAAAKLIGQASLLLDGFGLLEDGHVLRVIEVDLRRLGVRVGSYWVGVRELVAFGAAVIGFDYFGGRIGLLVRHRAIVQAVDVGVLLGLLLVDGLGSRVAA